MRKFAFLTSLLISSVPLMLLSFFFFNEMKSLSEERLLESIKREVDIATKNLNDFLNERVGNLEELSSGPVTQVAFEFARPEALSQNLITFKENYPVYEWIIVFDSVGSIFSSNIQSEDEKARLQDRIKDLDLLKPGISLRNSEIYVSGQVKDKQSSALFGVVVTKITDDKIKNFSDQLKGHLGKIRNKDIAFHIGPMKNSDNEIQICPSNIKEAVVPFCVTLKKNYLMAEASNLGLIFVIVTLVLITLTFYILSKTFKRILEPYDQIHSSLVALSSQDYVQININSRMEELQSIQSRFNSVIENIKVSDQMHQDQARNNALYEISRQVAHDIRSPVAALGVAVENLPGLASEVLQIIEDSITRINDIANDLLDRNLKDRIKVFNPNDIILKIVSEKKLIFLDIDAVAFHLVLSSDDQMQILMDQTDFSRIISNILNNAIESLQESKRSINISTFIDKSINIVIEDFGKGIPEDIISKIGAKGFSYGKSGSGSGLGLFHAIETVRVYGGELSIKSKLGIGTQIHIALPLISRDIFLEEGSLICIIDDDPLMHDVWAKKLESFKALEIVYLNSPEEFKDYSFTNLNKKIYGFVDYEFRNSDLNGIDVINSYRNITWYLISNRYDDITLYTKARNSRVELIPKSYLSNIRIHLDKTNV